MEEIKIIYHNKDMGKIEAIEKGSWIDLRAAETVEMKAGDFKLISLGVSMKLPEGYEAHIVPRSSTFKKWGILQANHQAVIDPQFCTTADIWRYPAIAMRNTTIYEGDRICQFRIIKVQPDIEFIEVDKLEGEARGGFGTTGSR